MFKPIEVTAMRRAVRADQERKREAARFEPVTDEGHLSSLAALLQSHPALCDDLDETDDLRADLERLGT